MELVVYRNWICFNTYLLPRGPDDTHKYDFTAGEALSLCPPPLHKKIDDVIDLLLGSIPNVELVKRQASFSTYLK